MPDLDRRERMRRWTRRADLTRKPDDRPQQLEPGRWVVVADQFGYHPRHLAMISDGPVQVMEPWPQDDLWDLHDGSRRPRAELTLLDVADVLGEAIVLLQDIRCARYRPGGDQTAILRVHRTACLARGVPCRHLLSIDALVDLDAVMYLDEQIATAEGELVSLLRERLPNLARALAGAALLALAAEPGWAPNTAGVAHPWLERSRRHAAGELASDPSGTLGA